MNSAGSFSLTLPCPVLVMYGAGDLIGILTGADLISSPPPVIDKLKSDIPTAS